MSMQRILLSSLALLLCLCAALFFPGCAPGEHAAEEGTTVLQVWAHDGEEAERVTLRAQVERFNAGREDVQVRLTFLPSGGYNAQVQAAALAGDLPDVLEFDGPFVYNYVWQGHLAPLDALISPELRENLIPSIIEQGMYRGSFYAVGMYDSGLGLFGRRSVLEAAGVRIPDGPADAWNAAEFDAVLAALAEETGSPQVLDLKLNYTGEWYPYAFSPPLQSAGGGLVDEEMLSTAAGALNGPASVAAMTWLQRWLHEQRHVDANVDDDAFTSGRVPLSWVGHWEYERYARAAGEDLVLLPLPDFGEGTRTGQGSWNWGITARSAHPEAAMAFIEFLLEDAQVLEMTAANGAVPATHSAIAQAPNFAEGGALRLYVEQLTEGYARPRPRTPAYPVIASVFEQAFHDIRNGADVQATLDHAAREIDQDFEANQGYPTVEPGG